MSPSGRDFRTKKEGVDTGRDFHTKKEGVDTGGGDAGIAKRVAISATQGRHNGSRGDDSPLGSLSREIYKTRGHTIH